MNVEIERKFVVTSLPADLDMSTLPSRQIDQGYLSNTETEAVRIRRKGDKYFLTYKAASGGHAAERTELETEITADQFETMWPGTAGKRLEKTRYEIPHGERTIELDIFAGDNDGHMLAEVEFSSTEEADAFTPPGWFGAEVTQDTRYGNASIAENGFPA